MMQVFKGNMAHSGLLPHHSPWLPLLWDYLIPSISFSHSTTFLSYNTSYTSFPSTLLHLSLFIFLFSFFSSCPHHHPSYMYLFSPLPPPSHSLLSPLSSFPPSLYGIYMYMYTLSAHLSSFHLLPTLACNKDALLKMILNGTYTSHMI